MTESLAGLGESRRSILKKENDGCDSWKVAAGILAVALLALTVVAVMARQGQLPSCTFGGQGGATVVAVASGVLTILALSLALCKHANGNKTPKPSREGSPRSQGKDGTAESPEKKDGGRVAAAVATVTSASNLASAGAGNAFSSSGPAGNGQGSSLGQPNGASGNNAAGAGQRRAPPPPPGDSSSNASAGAGNGPRPPVGLPPGGTRQPSTANAGDARGSQVQAPPEVPPRSSSSRAAGAGASVSGS